jgi:hypothetical protein
MSFRQGLTIIITLFFLFLFSNLSINEDLIVPAQSDSSKEPIDLNLYYFETRDDGSKWLVPYKPEEGSNNFIAFANEEYLNISQNFIDRKYNPEIKPELHLYINNDGEAGLEFNFVMEFSYINENNTLPSGPAAIAYFNKYTTYGRTNGPEEIHLFSTSFSDLPRDVPQTDYGAIFTISIFVEGGTNDTQLELCSGKDSYFSYVKTPYDKSYSSTVSENDGAVWEGMGLCYVIAGIFIAILVIIVLILHYRDWKNKK